MHELIKIEDKEINNETIQTVNARDLHEFLEVSSRYNDWIRNRITKYEFEENVDYVCLTKTLVTQTEEGREGSSTQKDHYISLDMAKELSMVERNEKGKEARKYFIQIEKQQAQALKALSNVTLDLSSNPIVYKGEDFYLSSLDVAKQLNKRHSNVLRDIEDEIRRLKSELAPEFNSILNGIKEVTYLDEQGKPRKAYELNELASYQILLRYSAKHRSVFLLQFKQMRDVVLNMFKLKVLDQVLPEYKGKRAYLYIIKNMYSGNIKIGVGSDPIHRLKQLQTGSDSELSLVYTSFVCSNAFNLETDVHKHYKNNHVRGEWFNIDENEVISFLEKQKYVLASNLDLSFDSKLLNLIKRED